MIVMSLEDVLFGKSKIFKDPAKLSIDYVPKVLPHRKKQLMDLAYHFRPFVTRPGSCSVRVLLVGPAGTGKTVVAKKFAEKVVSLTAARHEGRILSAYVNCHIQRRLFSIMQQIVSSVGLSISRRGYSTDELIKLLINYLNSHNCYLLAIIDEAHMLVYGPDTEAIYGLTRLTETYGDIPRVSLIFVFKNIETIFRLDRSVRGTLTHNAIKFEPYTAKQIYDILEARVFEEGALYPSAVDEEVLNMIAELVGHDKGGSGDARLAIEILYQAACKAEREGRSCIEPEDVRYAYANVTPMFSLDVVRQLRLMEKVLLLALVRILKRKKFTSKVQIGVLEKEYEDLCGELGLQPRRHTMVWEYVRNMAAMGIVSAEKSQKGFRGRSTLVGIPSAPLSILEKVLSEEIAKELEKSKEKESSS